MIVRQRRAHLADALRAVAVCVAPDKVADLEQRLEAKVDIATTQNSDLKTNRTTIDRCSLALVRRRPRASRQRDLAARWRLSAVRIDDVVGADVVGRRQQADERRLRQRNAHCERGGDNVCL